MLLNSHCQDRLTGALDNLEAALASSKTASFLKLGLGFHWEKMGFPKRELRQIQKSCGMPRFPEISSDKFRLHQNDWGEAVVCARKPSLWVHQGVTDLETGEQLIVNKCKQ